MKVLVYANKGKDSLGVSLNKLTTALEDNKIEYLIIDDNDLNKSFSASVLFVIGGDGTILCLNEFANKNNIPIVGINAGLLGFLTEFEKSDIEDAVNSLKNNKFLLDKRSVLTLDLNGNEYLALNDVYFQRLYDKSLNCLTALLQVNIDGISAGNFKGDGIVVATPTGSTAYSFASGGPILSPHLEGFVVTPISAHSFCQRSIVYSDKSSCEIKNIGTIEVGVYVDGKLVGTIQNGQSVSLLKANNDTPFLRRDTFNFFKILYEKLKIQFDGELND